MTILLRVAPCIAIAALVPPLAAQVQHAPQVGLPRVEARADLLAGRPFTMHVGGGLLWPIGRNVHLGLVAGAGASRMRVTESGEAHEWRASARGDIVARFVIDRADPGGWRPYGVAGAGMLGADGASPLARVFVGLGIERDVGGRTLRPAFELGVGGGMRAGIATRQGARTAR